MKVKGGNFIKLPFVVQFVERLMLEYFGREENVEPLISFQLNLMWNMEGFC